MRHETDTPRTDARKSSITVDTEFARQLERELSASKVRLDRINNDNFNLANALSKAEAKSESRRVALVAIIKANNKLEAEVDMLKNALESL